MGARPTKRMAVASGAVSSRQQALAFVAKARQWMASAEGKKAMQEAAERGTPVADRLRAARRIDQESLREPIG
ncbi:hypothetical protein LLG95_10600 [bacterium]|nr:hypothetical protein [bacterium]